MIVPPDSFLNFLNRSLCRRVFEKQVQFSTHKIHLWVYVKSVEWVKGRLTLQGVRVCGWMYYGGVEANKKELADIEYKKYINKSITTYYLLESVWTVLSTRLKHFNLNRGDVSVQDNIYFMKIRRFHAHTKRMMPLTD
jgi:hypothetical protein